MRILQIHPLLRGDRIYPLAGGKSRVAAGLSEYLALAGHSVALFAYPERLFLPPHDYRGVEGGQLQILSTAILPTRHEIIGDVARLGRARMRSAGPRGDNGGFDLLALTALRRALEEFRPDVVHCHHTFSDFPFLYRATRARPPLLLTHHAYQASTDIRLYDWVVFVSNDWREKILGSTGFPLQRTRLIYNPVSKPFGTGEVKPHREREGVVFSGNLSRRKGLHLLIQAYKETAMLRAHPLTVCGTGEEEQTCRELVMKNGLPVTFRGRLSVDEVRDVVRGAAVLVNPSSSEGFSVALLEAVCCGTPVVGYPAQLTEMQSIMGMRVGASFDAQKQTPGDLGNAVLAVIQGTTPEMPDHETLAERARDLFSMTRAGEAMLALYAEAVRAQSE